LFTLWDLILQALVLMNASQEKWHKRAKALGWIIGGATVGLCALVTPFILPALRKHCLPFVPATTQQVRVIVQHARGKRLVDIGSGDGRVVSIVMQHFTCTIEVAHTARRGDRQYRIGGYYCESKILRH